MCRAGVLRVVNSMVKDISMQVRFDCWYLKIENSKFCLRYHCQDLMPNVRRAVIVNSNVKNTVLSLFTKKLEELVLKKNLIGSSVKSDMLLRLIQEGQRFRNLRLLSISGNVGVESLITVLSNNVFPRLEVIKIRNDQLRVSTHRITCNQKLKYLKRLDIQGCCVKVDGGTKALGRMKTQMKLCQKGEADSEDDVSSADSDLTDELEEVRANFEGGKFNFDKHFLF